jgi:hypothetical protein
MILDRLDLSPLPQEGDMYDGMMPDGTPGKILALWADARRMVGTLEAKTKSGVKFKVRANEDLVDKLSAACDHLGILVYPSDGAGKGHVVEDGTLAEVELMVVVQAVEDGSKLGFWGFGLGADNQDKAGGKAGTYAFKQALVQAALAGGTKDKKNRLPDTDDTDTPIEGGVKPKTSKPKAPSFDEVKAALEASHTEAEYRAALAQLKAASPSDQVKLAPIARMARAICIPETAPVTPAKES